MKPYSAACERNQEPIFQILSDFFADRQSILEIGSGTGQHAVYFAPRLPFLEWHPSDRAEYLEGIHAWLAAHPASNLKPPRVLDVDMTAWPKFGFDGIFTANTLHIMSLEQGHRLLAQAGKRLPRGGKLAIYGPFNYDGRYTGKGNEHFDYVLRERSPHSGIRDFEDVCAHAEQSGLTLVEDFAMPADNHLLAFERTRRH